MNDSTLFELSSINMDDNDSSESEQLDGFSLHRRFWEGLMFEVDKIFDVLQQDGPGFDARAVLDELQLPVSTRLVREAVSLLIIQITELLGALALLQYTARPQHKLINFFQGKKSLGERNWIQASVLGFGFLISLVLLTSLLADRLMGVKDVNVLILKEILSSGNAAKASCFIVYCIITPVQEEIVYRGFLLTSLASTMKWQQAVIISACVFSAAHLSWENTPQFFAIGCILGCAYCWTGNLASSFTIHSLYNAVILLSTILA